MQINENEFFSLTTYIYSTVNVIHCVMIQNNQQLLVMNIDFGQIGM